MGRPGPCGGGFAGLAVPFGNVLAPLVVWLAKKDESRFVDENGVRALNFQLTWSIILLATALSVLVAVGVVLFPLALLAWLIQLRANTPVFRRGSSGR